MLAFARLTNQALSFLGPVLMVRLLSVEEYGHYRDFLLYGTLLLPWIQLSLNSSLAYFVPKDPENGRVYLSQVHFFVLCSSCAVTLLVLLFGDHLPSTVVRSYVYPLALYVLFFSNLDAWEVYWLAKRQIANVLYYSVVRLGVRTAVVVAAAYLTRRVEPVIWSLVAFEGLRMLALVVYGLRARLFTRRFSTDAIRRQLGFSLPLGASGIIFNLNAYLGQFFVSMFLGPAALAVYAVGTYLQPIIQVFRNSVADVIMPEIVSQRNVPSNVALRLWQRATVVYCATMLPLAAVLFYYADVVVETLFTSAYAAATPIFQLYVFLLVRECFDFGLPLRAVNRTQVFLPGGVFALAVNVVTILALFEPLGLLAPAVAMVVTRFVAGAYLAVFVIKHCGFSLGNMLPWADMAKTVAVAMLCVPILVAGDALDVAPVLRALLVGACYLSACFVLLSIAGIPEIRGATDRLWLRMRNGRVRAALAKEGSGQ